MFLVVFLEVGEEAHEGGGGDGVALAGDHILRRVELGEMVSEEERADGRGEEGVCEVRRQAAQRVGGHDGGSLGRVGVGIAHAWVASIVNGGSSMEQTWRDAVGSDTSCVVGDIYRYC